MRRNTPANWRKLPTPAIRTAEVNPSRGCGKCKGDIERFVHIDHGAVLDHHRVLLFQAGEACKQLPVALQAVAIVPVVIFANLADDPVVVRFPVTGVSKRCRFDDNSPTATGNSNLNDWFIYLIRTARGTLYTGISRDVERRFAEHQGGGARAAKALRGRGPLKLEFHQAVADRSEALKLEMQIKKWPKKKKEALIAGGVGLSLPANSSGPQGDGPK